MRLKTDSAEVQLRPVACDDGYFCVFAGEKDENEAVLKALEEVFK